MYFVICVICYCNRLGDEECTDRLDVGLEWMNNSKLCDLDYADHIVLLENSLHRMQLMTEAAENEGKKVELYRNVGKCKVLVSKDCSDDTEIKIGGSAVETVEDFCYLDSFLMNNSSCEKDCQTRIGKATSVFERLKPVWKNKQISLALKVRLYESLVISIMLYSAELWPLSVTQKRSWKQHTICSNNGYWASHGGTSTK